jgi:transposase-like protein
MARASYSDEVKAQVMAALLAGQSVNAVAREYNIPKGTVSSWKDRDVPNVAKDATQKESLDNLLFGYVQESLKTLKAQVIIFSDESWIKRQSASELAILHGVITDKAIRLLEAAAQANESGAE